MTATVTEMLGGTTNGGGQGGSAIEAFSLLAAGAPQGGTFSPSSAAPAPAPSATSSSSSASGEEMIVVPAGLIGGILGAIGGVVGQIVGGNTGNTISTVSGVVGTVLPFSTVPGTAADGQGEEDLVAVPAGLLGGLVGGLGGIVGKLIGGRTGQAISGISGTVGSLLPMSSGPDAAAQPGARSPEDLVLVPAGLFGSLIKIVSDVGGRAIGGRAGNAVSTIGGAVGDIVPFSTVPGGNAGEEMVVLPAGLFGDLVGAVGGLAGHFIGGKAGRVITDVSGAVRSVAPFSVIPQR